MGKPALYVCTFSWELDRKLGLERRVVRRWLAFVEALYR